jgi:hypothetical protein
MAQQNPVGTIIGGAVALIAVYLLITNLSKIQAALGTSFAPQATASSATATGFAAGLAAALGISQKPTTATLANIPTNSAGIPTNTPSGSDVNPALTYSAGSPLAGPSAPFTVDTPSETDLPVGLMALSN